ncbi:MAG: fibronectin type III domain-containing protein [Chloroflexota bacterium]|nr:fibronectin type III domain-containing protein [Chloroflexota bacterium]
MNHNPSHNSPIERASARAPWRWLALCLLLLPLALSGLAAAQDTMRATIQMEDGERVLDISNVHPNADFVTVSYSPLEKQEHINVHNRRLDHWHFTRVGRFLDSERYTITIQGYDGAHPGSSFRPSTHNGARKVGPEISLTVIGWQPAPARPQSMTWRLISKSAYDIAIQFDAYPGADDHWLSSWFPYSGRSYQDGHGQGCANNYARSPRPQRTGSSGNILNYHFPSYQRPADAGTVYRYCNLLPNTAYDFELEAARHEGSNINVIAKSVFRITTNMGPIPPTPTPPPTPGPPLDFNFRIASLSHNSVTLEWEDLRARIEVSGYFITVGTVSGNDFTEIAQRFVTNNETSASFYLQPDTDYRVRFIAYLPGIVKGTNIDFRSPPQPSGSPAIAPDPPRPSLSMGVGVSSGNEISVSWNDVGANEYTLILAGGDRVDSLVLPSGTTSHTFSGLQADTAYTIRVTAFFPGGHTDGVEQIVHTPAEDEETEPSQQQAPEPAQLQGQAIPQEPVGQQQAEDPPQPVQQQQQAEDPPQPVQQQQQAEDPPQPVQQQQQAEDPPQPVQQQQQAEDPPQPVQQQQAEDPPQPVAQQQDPDPPQPQQAVEEEEDPPPTPIPPTPIPPTPIPPTPIPPTPIPPTPIPPPTNTPVPPPPEPAPEKRGKIKLSVSDITRDSLTVRWNEEGDLRYLLELFDVAARQYKITGGNGGSRTYSGLSPGSDYEILILVYSGDDRIDSDFKTVRTAD